VSGNTFNAANAMTAFGPQTLSYDANGNLTGDGTDSYAWDARNHLSAIGGGVTASFQYDPFGRRTQKTINGLTTQLLYDGLNPVQELDGSSPPNVTANLLTGRGIDQYFTRTDSAGARNFLTDMLGSTIGLADFAGTLQTQYSYDPFGNAIVSGAPSANPYQFTGRESDDTGLYYYRARYYDPTFQGFIGQDPIGLAGLDANRAGADYAYATIHPPGTQTPVGHSPLDLKPYSSSPYLYALDNPIEFTDPSGLDVYCQFFVAGGYYFCFSTDGSYPPGIYSFTCPGLLGPGNCPNTYLVNACHFSDDQFGNLLRLEKTCWKYQCS